MDLVDIQKALIKDDLGIAISGMLNLASELGENRLQDHVVLQSGRYHGNEKRNTNGTISQEQYNRTRNQLRAALQQIVKDFPGYSSEVNLKAQQAIAQEGNTTTKQSSQKTSPATDATIKILILSANPTETAALKLNDEYALISKNRDRSPNSGKFPIVSHQAVTLPEFTRYLFSEKPSIVHFSGHGELENKETRDFIRRGQGLDDDKAIESDNTGIILTDTNKRDPLFVGTSVIRQIFSTMIHKRKIPIQAVIFNSCYSAAQAEAIADLVPHVIGTSWSISDQAAIAFADGFYSFFTETEDIEAAWDDGVIQAMAYGEPKDKFIYYKNGEKVMDQ